MSRSGIPTTPSANFWYYNSSDVPGPAFRHFWETAAGYAIMRGEKVRRAKFTNLTPERLTIVMEGYNDASRNYTNFELTLTHKINYVHSGIPLPP